MFVLMLLQTVILFIIFVISGLYIYYKFFIFNYWRKKGIPYVEPTFPFGNMRPYLSASMADNIGNLCQQYKKDRFVGLYMSHVPVLVVTDPDLIRSVLQKEFDSFHSRGLFSDGEIDLFMKNLVCVPGNKWRNLHTNVKMAYSLAKIKQILPLWQHGSNSLLKYLKAKAESKTTIDLVTTITRYYTDVLTASAFGLNTTSLTETGEILDDQFPAITESMTAIHPIWVIVFMFFPEYLSYLKKPIIKPHIRNFFIKLVEDLVEYRNSNNIKSKDIFDGVMQLMKNSNVTSDNTQTADSKESVHTEFTMDDVIANTFIVYVAGHETTSLVTTYCLYELSKNPDIQDKTRKELTSVLQKHGAVTYDALSEMTYLDKVISETMRMYPSVPVLTRICNQDIELPKTDIHIPKGLRLLIPIVGIHWDPDIYPDPHKFDPERFSKENVASRPSHTYFPFGQGPRMCVGAKMAWTMVKYTIAMALSKYKFRCVTETPGSIILAPGQMVLTPSSNIPLAVELL